MSKRRPDADKIANELSGASAFFKPRPVSAPAPPPLPEPREAQLPPFPVPAAPTIDQSPAAVERAPEPDRPPARPGRVVKRQMIRHPFELYLDQLERLRETAHTDRLQGGAGSMSRMVRDAIDQFLAGLPPAD